MSDNKFKIHDENFKKNLSDDEQKMVISELQKFDQITELKEKIKNKFGSDVANKLFLKHAGRSNDHIINAFNKFLKRK